MKLTLDLGTIEGDDEKSDGLQEAEVRVIGYISALLQSNRQRT